MSIQLKGNDNSSFSDDDLSIGNYTYNSTTTSGAEFESGSLTLQRPISVDGESRSIAGRWGADIKWEIDLDGSASFASIVYATQTAWEAINYYDLALNAICFRNGASGGVKLDANATAWGAISQRSLKTDFLPITDGLSKVNQLSAVTGRYKTDDDGTSRSFLIADEVQAVLPEAVSGEGTEENPLSLRYIEVIPLLVSALHDAKDRIEALEAEVQSLKGGQS